MSTGQACKQWLLRKAQSFLGTSRLQSQLAQIGEDLRSVQAATLELQRTQSVARHGAALWGTADNLPPADESPMRALELQGLYILGAARSGTTILTRSLNRAPEILVLEEPSFFLNEPYITDFVGFFNNLHAQMGNRCMKGTYLAPPRTPEVGPLAALHRLRRDYRYVGEKTAIGPHDYPKDWPRRYLDFQSRYFLRAKYINILRTPVESIWSMHKMFPDRPVIRLLEAWLRAVSLSLEAYHVFPNSRVVFFDDLGPSMIERLGAWLDASISCDSGTFGRSYMHSSVSGSSVPEALRPIAAWCHQCTDLYRDLRDNFSKVGHTYCGSMSEWAYFDASLRRIEEMLVRLEPDAAEKGFKLQIAA